MVTLQMRLDNREIGFIRSNMMITALVDIARGLIALALVSGIFAVSAKPALAQTSTPIVVESYLIPSGDAGIQLYVRNKRPGAATTFPTDRTVLYVHGSTQASETTFDLVLNGKSWMDHLAEHGWDVWLMDVRGYGQSTKPPEMERPAVDSPPIAPHVVAMRDVRTAVEHILAKRAVSRISLIGWSRGAALVGSYASENPTKVQRLVLHAPGWVRTAAPAGSSASIPAYQAWTTEQARARLQAGVPSEKQAVLLPPSWRDAWAASALSTDPVGAAQTPPVVRSPAGTIEDGRDYWSAGKPLYDPSRIIAPTLIVTAAWDDVNPPALGRAVFAKLTSAVTKRYVEIGDGSHLVMLERNRLQLFREVQLFLDEPQP
jgi:pimeloyl-ACP methyl ester carboxylesterase